MKIIVHLRFYRGIFPRGHSHRKVFSRGQLLFSHLNLWHLWPQTSGKRLRHQNRVPTVSECRRFRHRCRTPSCLNHLLLRSLLLLAFEKVCRANPIKFSAWQKGRFRLAIEMDAGEKRAIRGVKGAEMSVFGITMPLAIGAYLGGAAAANRLEPTVARGSTHPKKIRTIAV